MQKRKVIINIRRNLFNDILSLNQNILNTIDITSWCLGFDGKRRRNSSQSKFNITNSFKKIWDSSKIANIKNQMLSRDNNYE